MAVHNDPTQRTSNSDTFQPKSFTQKAESLAHSFKRVFRSDSANDLGLLTNTTMTNNTIFKEKAPRETPSSDHSERSERSFTVTKESTSVLSRFKAGIEIAYLGIKAKITAPSDPDKKVDDLKLKYFNASKACEKSLTELKGVTDPLLNLFGTTKQSETVMKKAEANLKKLDSAKNELQNFVSKNEGKLSQTTREDVGSLLNPKGENPEKSIREGINEGIKQVKDNITRKKEYAKQDKFEAKLETLHQQYLEAQAKSQQSLVELKSMNEQHTENPSNVHTKSHVEAFYTAAQNYKELKSAREKLSSFIDENQKVDSENSRDIDNNLSSDKKEFDELKDQINTAEDKIRHSPEAKKYAMQLQLGKMF